MRTFLLACLLWGGTAAASVVPPGAERQLKSKPVTEFFADDSAHFSELIDPIVDQFQQTVAAYGGTVTKQLDWDSNIVNATAYIIGNEWRIVAFGGLYRLEGMTDDGFQLAICHEAGHLLGGFPYYPGISHATSEGQADYFGAQICARSIWRAQLAANHAAYLRAPQAVKDACSDAWEQVADVELCGRIAVTAQDLIANLSPDLRVSLETPDPSVSPATIFSGYPTPQCRIDTYLRGALCDAAWDFSLIPGRDVGAVNSIEAEAEAHRYSCHKARSAAAARPSCWYSQRVDLP